MKSVELSPELNFAYGQFYVYDKGSELELPMWTKRCYVDQGFVRVARSVAFGTLVECGTAIVSIHFGAPYSLNEIDRAIAVPFMVVNGFVMVDGPEEPGCCRCCEVENGHYRLVVTQKLMECDVELDWGQEHIQLFMEKLDVPLKRSEILVADTALEPPVPLIEPIDEDAGV